MTIHQDADATGTAWLAAQIAADQPTLPNALRSSTSRICKYADLLEAELKHFRPLEGYMVDAIKEVETRTGRPVSDELYNRLCDRFGVTEVRIALERVEQAHPDATEEPYANMES